MPKARPAQSRVRKRSRRSNISRKWMSLQKIRLQAEATEPCDNLSLQPALQPVAAVDELQHGTFLPQNEDAIPGCSSWKSSVDSVRPFEVLNQGPDNDDMDSLASFLPDSDRECVDEEDEPRALPAVRTYSGPGPSVRRENAAASSPDLVYETVQPEPDPLMSIIGRRIVDLALYTKSVIQMTLEHRRCTTGKYVFVKEKRLSLGSELHFHCDTCNRDFRIPTVERPDDLNKGVVWGATSVGIGYSQAQEMLSVLEVPMLSTKMYANAEEKVADAWHGHLEDQMKANGEKELAIAKQRDQYEDNWPYISVIVDGGWAKRTYGHSYNASSGVACIIGAETGLLLYLGVKNKYCYVCHRTPSGATPPTHKCFMNYKGSSTAMEQEAIVDGFNKSESQHKLRYKYVIGDGDSSVYSRIVERCSYGRCVEKLECANHMVRCYTSKLFSISKDQQYTPKQRNEMAKFILRLKRAARGAIRNAGDHRTVELLRQDLKNGPRHVFGDHARCRPDGGYCDEGRNRDRNEVNVVPVIEKDNMLVAIYKAGDALVRNANKMVFNRTTNLTENYNSVVVKFTGAKRVDFTKRGSYQTRCEGAALSVIGGPNWPLPAWKMMTGRSPGMVQKKECARRDRRHQLRCKRRLEGPHTTRKRPDKAPGPDKDYGAVPDQDMALQELEAAKQELLDKIQNEVPTLAARDDLELRSKGQNKADDPRVWKNARNNRLTASNFGKVCSRMATTSCHNLLKSMYFKEDLSTNKYVAFGIDNEDKAIAKYMEETGSVVEKSGIFVDVDHPYLAASSDGLIGVDGLVEVKCVPSIGSMSFREAIDIKRNICLTLNKSNELMLKTSHEYYYQIQGQLNIAGREYCDLVVYATDDLHIQRLDRDQEFWQERMLPKLTRFYMDCILPELADSRINRKLVARDPPYILEAQELAKTRRQKRQEIKESRQKRKEADKSRQKRQKAKTRRQRQQDNATSKE